MNLSDLESLARGIAPVLAEMVADAIKPLTDEIEAMKGQLGTQKAAFAAYVERSSITSEALEKMVRDAEQRADEHIARAASVVADIPPRLSDEELEAKVKGVIAASDHAPWVLDFKGATVTDALRDQIRDYVERLPREPGKDADPEVIRSMVAEAVAALPTPENGKDGSDGVDGRDAAPVTSEQIAEAVKVFLESNPPAAGQDGRDGIDGKDGEPGPQGERGDSGADGRDGSDGLHGKDAEPPAPEVLAQIVARHLTENPPKDGQPGRDGIDGKDGAPGRDGCDATEAMIDRDGNLVVVFSDGRSKALGQVVGRDGVDGVKGDPGRDGLTLADFDTELSKDGRFLTLSLQNEAVKVSHRLQLPTMIYRGVFKQGETYLEGDMVTFGGSLWHCNYETTDKPIDGNPAWTLAAKRGRDGKDAKP